MIDRRWHQALPQLQNIVVSALSDKNLSLQGEITVMKFIGG
ncbi:MAG: hypothetical protein ACI9SB_002376 [Candidatus Azotimanducaceae bacterium]